MTGTEHDRLYLVHILECIARVRRYTEDGRDAYLADEKTQDAVVRNLQIMAESAQRLAEATKAQYPGIDWRRLRRFRNLVVHDYRVLDYARIWDLMDLHLDPLEEAVQQALSELDSSPERVD